MGRAVLVGEALDSLRKDFDAPRGRLERTSFGIGAKVGEQDEILARPRHLGVAFLPETLEARQVNAGPFIGCARALVEHAHPLHLVTSFAEGLLAAGPAGEFAKDVEIAAARGDRLYGLVHGDDESVARGSAHVVAFEGRRGRQYDVGPGAPRPPPPLLSHGPLRGP